MPGVGLHPPGYYRCSKSWFWCKTTQNHEYWPKSTILGQDYPVPGIQYILDKMETHFDPNCKHFCSDSHFIESPFYREKIARLYNFFRSPFPEKQTFWSRNPCCLTSFFSKSSHFRESLAICRQNPHFIENPFYREKIAAHFGGISRKIHILSNSHFVENVL